jgi:hypothetical protein
MIDVSYVTKEYVSSKKQLGFKGAFKGLLHSEKVRKMSTTYPSTSTKGMWWAALDQTEQASPQP